MKYLDEFQDKDLAAKLVSKISTFKDPATFMEVCGTHTVSIFRSGIKNLLPSSITLLSGPGCQVCVTPNIEIDKIIWLARNLNHIIVTFGDMLKVPGTYSSLEAERAKGSDIRIIYSPLEALDIARANPFKKVIFLGVGFETTIPAIGLMIETAKQENISNFFLFSTHKIVPPALDALLGSGELNLDGLILPGHVSAIIGTKVYDFISEKYDLPAVVTGFEPLDILQGIEILLDMKNKGIKKIANQYSRVVKEQGNIVAQQVIARVFTPANVSWRGMGMIPMSGLKLNKDYCAYDAEGQFEFPNISSHEPAGCICGEVIRGVKNPKQCQLFKNKCTPENPVGPCMVSSEGTCSAYYKYG
ncbi:MAG: hydrogenase formation protein HypD [bacterium]